MDPHQQSEDFLRQIKEIYKDNQTQHGPVVKNEDTQDPDIKNQLIQKNTDISDSLISSRSSTIDSTPNQSRVSSSKKKRPSSKHKIRVNSNSHVGGYEREAIEQILNIKYEIEAVLNDVQDMTKLITVNEYKQMEEFFIQKQLDLDKIETRDIETVRQLRKSVIVLAQRCLQALDSKTQSIVMNALVRHR